MTTFDPVSYLTEPRWAHSRPGLERVVALLDGLGNPEKDLRCIHVAGTNGKGSTSAFIARILQEAGYKTGLFSSPHIIEFFDRLRINDRNISLEDLREITYDVSEVADKMEDHPTEFELMAAVAFLYFKRQNCDIVVLEVGLGGRLDATNAIEKPELCVITPISFDHTDMLGFSLKEIAGEKAGIIKRGTPVVSWPQEDEAMGVIEDKARAQKAPLSVVDFDGLEIAPFEVFSVKTLSSKGEKDTSTASESFNLSGIMRRFSYRKYHDLSIQLLGSYQPYNAVLAIEAIEALRELGWNINEEALRKGLASTRWPGRFEIVQQNPTFIIDGGHNVQGARALADSLVDIFPGQKPIFIIGILKDKDYPEMLEAILGLGSAFVVIEPPSPRALAAEELAQAIRLTGQDLTNCSACANPYVAKDIPDALAYAKQLAKERREKGEENPLICAFGSLYSVEEIHTALGLDR